ncbi:MAG: SDR family oxidoreductase [Anaerolineae bacterium]|nr:SDR family oxidoreductase [Anaerolineae bacterium]
METAGKNALITGGAHRVGKAITLALARAGANVIVNYYSAAQEAEATAAEARALGVEALSIRADVSDDAQVAAMVEAAQARLGPVDILVNSASRFEKIAIPTDDLDIWRRVTRTSIDGAFYCANAVAPMMLEKGAGVIVNIVDLSAWEPWRHFTAHSVGKAGLLALTRQLALELAPAVRANAVAPGPVLPPPDYDAAQRARIARRTLLERWGSPEDVAGAVLYLVSADYVTGEVIVVDGGERFGRGKQHSTT